MASPATDEPLSPTGRLFLRPEMNQAIHCVLGLEKPLDVDALKSFIRDSFLLKHPRFRSLMVRDSRGLERWRRTSVDLDSHLIVVDRRLSSSSAAADDDDDEAAVNEYLADMSTGPRLSADKPLWEIHFLTAHRCIVLWIHHALGDGISLMSMLLSDCRKASDPNAVPTVGITTRNNLSKKKRTMWGAVVGLVGMLWFSLVFVVEFLMRLCWVCDRNTPISGGTGVEHWPRKLVTARFRMEDMKIVKRAVASATINDVLFGVISSGLSRYLEHRTAKALHEGLKITGLAMVNLRKQPGLQELSELMKSDSQLRWGNMFGIVLLPVQYHKRSADLLQPVKRAKVMLDRKKQSLEAHFSYKVLSYVIAYLGSKVAGLLNYRVICNTSFTISNIVGPQEDIAIGDNRVTYMRANSSSLPHALIMHMVSYAGRADMQILVAKDIIPDSEFLAKCFEDALSEMKEEASAVMKTC